MEVGMKEGEESVAASLCMYIDLEKIKRFGKTNRR